LKRSNRANPNEARDVLEALRFELKFLDEGGYACAPDRPWRAPYIFEESPTCLNYKHPTGPHACSECVLMRFVPPELRSRDAPCRFIPLDDEGQTIDSLYRTGTHAEMTRALRKWLQQEIKRIEAEMRVS